MNYTPHAHIMNTAYEQAFERANAKQGESVLVSAAVYSRVQGVLEECNHHTALYGTV